VPGQPLESGFRKETDVGGVDDVVPGPERLLVSDPFGHDTEPAARSEAVPQAIQFLARFGQMFDDFAQGDEIVPRG